MVHGIMHPDTRAALITALVIMAGLGMAGIAAVIGSTKAARGKTIMCDSCGFTGSALDVLTHMDDTHGKPGQGVQENAS